jgi:hypothetical protein
VRGGRNTALISLAGDLPAPVLADLLGLSITTVYRIRTRRRGCDLRFGQMNRVGQDRGLCLVAFPI